MSDDWIDTKAILAFKDVVRRPEFAESRICAICASLLGAGWQHNDDWDFRDGECPCCGRVVGLTMVSNWKWENRHE